MIEKRTQKKLHNCPTQRLARAPTFVESVEFFCFENPKRALLKF